MIVPAEDGDFEYHRPFAAGKHHHLGYPEDPKNPRKMTEVDGDPEVLLSASGCWFCEGCD
jgi:hypothetical protein